VLAYGSSVIGLANVLVPVDIFPKTVNYTLSLIIGAVWGCFGGFGA